MSSPRTTGTKVGWREEGNQPKAGALWYMSLVASQSTRAPHHLVQFPHSPPTPSGCPAHIGEVWLLAGAFLKEALALSTVLDVFSPVRGGQLMGLSFSPVSFASAQGCPEAPAAPFSAYLWVSVVGMPTGRSPSKCLPLGTSSTISVSRGISMAQRPPQNTALTTILSGICGSVSPSGLSLGSWYSLPHEANGHNTSLRRSLRTDRHMKYF